MATQRSISVNLDEIKGVMVKAAVKVSAFVRYGLDHLDDRDGGDFSLTSHLVYQFVPQDLPEPIKAELKEEYKSWFLGGLLRELDQHYSIFQDKLWSVISLVDASQKQHFDLDETRKFARNTNVAKKQALIAQRVGGRDHKDQLNSLSLARNALSHALGTVRAPNDCNNAARDQLHLKWLTLQMFAQQDGQTYPITDTVLDTHSLPGTGDVEIGMRVMPRELVFPSRARIILTPSHIAELCLFYLIICDQTLADFRHYLKTNGVQLDETNTP